MKDYVKSIQKEWCIFYLWTTESIVFLYNLSSKSGRPANYIFSGCTRVNKEIKRKPHGYGF